MGAQLEHKVALDSPCCGVGACAWHAINGLSALLLIAPRGISASLPAFRGRDSPGGERVCPLAGSIARSSPLGAVSNHLPEDTSHGTSWLLCTSTTSGAAVLLMAVLATWLLLTAQRVCSARRLCCGMTTLCPTLQGALGCSSPLSMPQTDRHSRGNPCLLAMLRGSHKLSSNTWMKTTGLAVYGATAS